MSNNEEFISKEEARELLDKARRELLDLSKRNRLIKFPIASKTSKQFLRFVGADLNKIAASLEDGRTLKFAPVPKPKLEEAERYGFDKDITPEQWSKIIGIPTCFDLTQKENLAGQGKEPTDLIDTLTAIAQEIFQQLPEKDPSSHLNEFIVLEEQKLKEKNELDKVNRVLRFYGFNGFSGFIWKSLVNSISVSPPQSPPFDDTKLHPLMFQETMDAYLRLIHKKSQTSIDEMGIGTLYMILGFLEWKENDEASEKLLSPLITYAVNLEKKRSANDAQLYKYYLSSSNEEPMTNLSLQESLKRDYDFLLPEKESDETIEDYLKRVEHSISTRTGWMVHRYAVLGILNFTKLSMYQDLVPESWRGGLDSFYSNPIFNFLLKKTGDAGNRDIRDEYDIDNLEISEDVIPLIDKADASQHSVLVDVLTKGKNLVVEGPPGTGKSQTIGNIIAGALNNRKTVLFVSEKTAALDVVKHRLDNAGLGDFCLAIQQTTGSDKRQVLNSINNRRLLQKPVEGTKNDNAESDYYKYRNELNKYAHLINSKWKNTGKSIQEIFAAKVRYQLSLTKQQRKDAHSTNIDVRNIKISETIEAYNQSISIFLDDIKTRESANGVTSVSMLPWYGVNSADVNNEEKAEDLIASLKIWQDNLLKRKKLLEEICANNGILSDDYARLEESIKTVPMLPALANYKKSLGFAFSNFTSEEMIAYLDSLEAISSTYREIEPKLRKAVIPEIRDFKHKEIPTFDVLGIKEDSPLTLMQIVNLMEEFKENILLLHKVETRLDGIRLQIPELSSRIVCSVEGYEFLLSLIKQICLLDPELYEYRSDCYDSYKTGQKIEQLSSKLELILRHAADLESIFDIDEAIRYDNLKDIALTIKNRKLLSFLSSSYRSAKRTLLSITIDDELDLDSLAEKLNELDYLREKIVSLNQTEEYKELFGDLFDGRYTQIDKIRELRQWYLEIRNTWGFARAPDAYVGTSLIDMDSSLLREINSDSKQLIEDISQILAFFLELKTTFPALQGNIEDNWGKNGKNLEGSYEWCDSALADVQNFIDNYSMTCGEIHSLSENYQTFWDTVVSNRAMETRFAESIPGFQSGIAYAADPNNQSDKLTELKESIRFAQELRKVEAVELREAVSAVNKEQYCSLCKSISLWKEVCRECEESRRLFYADGKIDDKNWISCCGDGNSLNQIINRNDRALNHSTELKHWGGILVRQNDISAWLKPFCDKLMRGEISEDPIFFRNYVFFAIYSKLCDEILHKYPDLRYYNKVKAENNQKLFRKKDSSLIESNRKLVADNLLAWDVPAGTIGRREGDFSETQLLIKEINKKKRHIPLRQLIRRAGKAIQALKPCWMMSPLTVARYLAPDTIKFDLIVMDEASQIRPADAYGALLRGNQVVVVGDSKQLPPTSFFVKSGEEESFDEDEFIHNESILDEAALNFPNRMLRWHYRSRHESLISFSNRWFYDSRLIVFPSPNRQSEGFGIHFTYVKSGVFENRKNFDEAEAVVNAIIEHARKHPKESLAVVTMNAEQQDLIETMLDTRQVISPQVKACVSNLYTKKYPLIIKNLENIQGDERDVVFISCTYGKMKGTNSVPQRFGPINRSDGWRRLNVLFTRARKRVHVFSSMHASDIIPSSSSSSYESLAAFSGYLREAENRGTPYGVKTSKKPDSDFEVAVCDYLERHGFQCDCQVGAENFFIDIAVVDPNNPDRYLMGIECDGASYHSAKSARDRDLIRQEILESLGWKIRRIWSTDWFNDPDDTIKPIIAELEDVVRQSELEKEQVEEYVSLPDKLKKLAGKIAKEFPSVPPNEHLLRQEMINYLVATMPLNQKAFTTLIPINLREHTNAMEAGIYLDKVFEIINDYA